MRHLALALFAISTHPAVAIAADPDTAVDSVGWSDGLSIVAVAILILGLLRVMTPDREARSR